MFKASETPFIFMTLVKMEASAQAVKQEYEDGKPTGKPKLTKSGKTQYATGLKALAHEDGQITYENKNVGLSVEQPVDLVPGVMYAAVGEIEITPYVSNGRVAYSITATTVKPLKAGSAE
ncbi:hypothetical protein ACFSWE_14965 [Leucobacter albus]|uniref:Uncharacterized protein n=1 Tax=Leucobacter albus TaxID=272210 RepID=A0ABW3TN11_9MICO